MELIDDVQETVSRQDIGVALSSALRVDGARDVAQLAEDVEAVKHHDPLALEDGAGQAGVTVQKKAFRAYFQFLDVLTEVENASGIKIWVNPDDATGIDNVNANLNHNDAIYNLAGQRVGKDYKGIVVTKGKKALR